MGSFKEIKTYPNTGVRLLDLTDKGKTNYVIFLNKPDLDKTRGGGDSFYQQIGRKGFTYFVTRTGKIEVKSPEITSSNKDVVIEKFDDLNNILADLQYKEKFQKGFKRRGSGEDEPDKEIFTQKFDFINGMKILVGRPKEKQLYLLTLDKDVTRLSKDRYNEFATKLRDEFGFFYKGSSFQKWSEKEYDTDYWHKLGDFLTQYFTQSDWLRKQGGKPKEETPREESPKEEPMNRESIMEAIDALKLIVDFSSNEQEQEDAQNAIDALELLL